MDGGVGEALLISSLIGAGSSIAAGAMSKDPVERTPYTGALSPENMLQAFLNKQGPILDNVANQQYSLPDAYVQTPPTIVGPGLPGAIGLTGSDPRNGQGISTQDVVKSGATVKLDRTKGPNGQPTSPAPDVSRVSPQDNTDTSTYNSDDPGQALAALRLLGRGQNGPTY